MPRDLSSVRLARLNGLLQLLREHGALSGETVRRALEYGTPRMLERDLAYLQEQFHVEVVYDRHRKVYILRNPGTFVLRLALSEREALVLAAGLEMAGHFLPHLKPWGESVWEKLRAVIPGALAREAEALACSTVVSLPVSLLDPGIFEKLLDARRRGQAVETRYTSPYDHVPEERRHLLSPWGVYFRAHAWYLWAWSHEAGEERIFRISRFRWVEPAMDAYVDPPMGSDVTTFADGAWYAHAGKGCHDVTVRIAPPLSRVVVETQWHATQVLTENPDGSVILRACVPSLDEVARWVLASAPHAEAQAPEALREMVKTLGDGVVKGHEGVCDATKKFR